MSVSMTVIGNLTADPELRFTPSGAAVCNFTIAETGRKFDRDTNEWKDGITTFYNCSVWRQAAENAAESLVKGMRVIAHGQFEGRPYEDRDGNKRVSIDLNVDEVGPSLKYATAKVTKTTRQGGDNGGQPQGNQGGQQGGWGNQPQQSNDPWASQPAGVGAGPASEEPPF